MSNQNSRDIVTGKVRLSYAHLFTAYAHQPGAEPKFSTTILVPKSDIMTKQKLDAAINAAIAEGVASKWSGVRPPILAIPIYDGDGVRPSDGMPFGDECKGHWVFTASSKAQPSIVDINVQPILNQSEVYSGIYARVSVSFYPYASNGKKGVGCGLGPVQKLEDGESLGGGISAAQAFGSAPAQTTFGQAPQQYQQPVQQYGQPQQYQPIVQQQYQQPAQPPVQQYQQSAQQFDPITGAPINGGVMGI